MDANQINTEKELHWVYQSMINWANLSTDRTKIKKIARTGNNTFFYLKGKVHLDNIHAYYGYYKEKLYIHFIPSSADVANSFLDQSVIPVTLHSCLVTNDDIGRGPIESADANQRIQRWADDKYRDQVLDTATFIQLFWIPNENFEDNTPLKINFAIHNDEVDLVLTQMNTMDSFLNTCKPIPPFKPTLTQGQFALLEQIKIWNV